MSSKMVTIVMALYKPNLQWLEEELISIHEQSYKNFQVFVWNDCPEDTYDYETFFKKHLAEINFKVFKGEKNMGSNGVFEKLTELTDTPYIAYCDQDDIWCPDKLKVLIDLFNDEQDISLAFSDMAVIDENSKLVSENISSVRPRQKFYTGKDVLAHLLAKNFVAGCTMMMKTEIAKAALPFPKAVFHDWWLAVYAAVNGNIIKAQKPLIKYRIYGDNQSAVLKGVSDKKSYYEMRIKKHKEFISFIAKSFEKNPEVLKAKEWNFARENYFFHPSYNSLKIVLSAWNYNRSTVLLEVLLPFMPEFIFKKIIEAVKAGKI